MGTPAFKHPIGAKRNTNTFKSTVSRQLRLFNLYHIARITRNTIMTTAAPQYATAAHNLSQSARAEAEYANVAQPSTFIPRGDTIVTLNYFRPPEDGSAPYNYVEKQADGHQRNFVDDASIKEKYYPEVEKLILDNVEGSNRVFIFDHTIRRSNPNAPRAPVTRVHIDQTKKSATARVHHHLPDEAEKLLQGRYRLINVWRPLNGPVQGSPLAFASSSSLKDEDLIPIEHR